MEKNNSYNDWIVIGISGVTNGGKTTLASKLAELLQHSAVLHQDAYFYPDDSPNHIKCSGLEHNNYDIITSLDMPKMLNDALAILQGKSDFKLLSTTGKLFCPGKKFLIIEGFTVLNYKPLFDICDLKYYLVLEYEECLRRRFKRIYDPPNIPGYFEQIVWPEHVKAHASLKDAPGLVILDGSKDLLPKVLADLRALGVREDERS
ncbi:Nicotinamide riboside kinase 1 [Eumeta japonica]|uniref:Nicotinamide riboside kinase 1 n=1 Tax=Eumeta variegata TaxID=151549 RepID=A0A4C1XN16_EUMVA|nr:Nicotinamide riboside kinase 1 [Eumeta japonica]